MLNVTITGSRPATECDRCDGDYRQQCGCKKGSSNTEVMACQIEHVKYRESGQMRH